MTQVKKQLMGLIGVLMVCLSSTTVRVFAQEDPNFGIIPAPVSIKTNHSTFKIDKNTVIVANGTECNRIAQLFQNFILNNTSLHMPIVQRFTAKQKAIVLTDETDSTLPEEGYTIAIQANLIRVNGKNAGLFYGLQTLMQVIHIEKNAASFAGLTIRDYPRFKYRGLMLDVGRHFYPVSYLKSTIDVLAYYKINRFHWHLTEDQGWRIEIKKYPKLTQIGSSRNGTIIGRKPGFANTNTVYQGFYTQDEAREIVRYAAERYVEVIPEIEMPGHSSAAIASYPWLSCFPDRDSFVADFTPWSGFKKGKQVQQTWGVTEDVYVPTEQTFAFLQDVLEEIMAIFPSKYIHIGGDECPKTYWKESDFCQNLMKEKGLKNEDELQSYFITRIEKFVSSKGRKIIGWDGILEGGLAPEATVMSWRGEVGGIEAAQLKHDAIMTSYSGALYLDHRQSANADEPVLWGGLAHYKKVYEYDPVPKVLSDEQKKFIIGVQANLWAEYMVNSRLADYQLYPRLMALAEIAWTPLERKNLQNFQEQRLAKHLADFDKNGHNFWVPTPIGQDEGLQNGDLFAIKLKSPIKGGKIYYSLDESRPSENTLIYMNPFQLHVPKGEKRILKTIVVAPSGRRSVVQETIYNNGAGDVKMDKKS
ncbi:beta-N-acetylhexosaminidase [Pedobacter sp. MW01-1-1]|uniref:beta-N-acetylhexosaminidase n=1 Tax=Pedobacter sp. MW01-1-1 TaxID=3383027 RepID=UPI003FF11518